MDYFDALLRAAGLAGGGAAAAAVEPRAAAPDLVELSDEVEVPSTPTVHLPARTAPTDANGAPVDAPAAAVVQPARTSESRAPDPIGDRPESLRAAVQEPRPTPREPLVQATAGVHPLVQAALHWVAAGSTAADEPQAADPQLPSVIELTPKNLPMQAARVSPTPHATAIETAAQNAASEKRRDGRSTSKAVAAAPLQRAAEAEPMRPPRRPNNSPVAPPLPEVHIGAIHLTVDAPRPPALPPVPAPPQPAARSAFLRSRAPRL
jgi:hypothetical protein